MNHLYVAATEIQNFLRSRRRLFCFIGGLAIIRWGQPRLTQDVDLTVWTDLGQEEAFLDDLLTQFAPRDPHARQRALLGRVMLLVAHNGVEVDLALGATGIEQSAISRATTFSFAPQHDIMTCSAEDLIVFKAFADRPLDWGDVRSVLVRQGDQLDWPYIEKQLIPLCELKENSEIVPRLRRLREETRP